MSMRIHVIINPASGQDQPILNTLNDVFSEKDVDWEVSLTKKAGDGQRLAKQAIARDVDVLAVYGGDGSVVEVASGILDSDVPMAILPGGTSNIVARELDLPRSLARAADLATDTKSSLRPVDMGILDNRQFFIQRIGVGLDAEMIRAATRELKDKFGNAAYFLGGLTALSNPTRARYRLILDGKELERDSVFCMISNTGKLGLSNLKTFKDTDISDGLLDVMLFQSTQWQTIRSKMTNAIQLGRKQSVDSLSVKPLDHWQAKEIKVEAEPPQLMHVDGDVSGQTPIEIKVIADAVKVIVPSWSA